MKKANHLLAVAGALAMFTSIAQADSWSITLLAAAVEADSAREADSGIEDGVGLELIGQNAVTERAGYQLFYSGVGLDAGVNGDKGIDAFGANFIYGKLNGSLQGYVLAGLGFSRVDIDGGEKDTHEHLNLGFGGLVSVSEQWSVASEVKLRRTFDDTSLANENKYDDVSLGLGVTYHF